MGKFPTKKEIIVLELLENKSMCGYELSKNSNGQLTIGGVYTILNRMCNKKYLKIKQKEVFVIGRPGRRYSVTKLGKRMLRFVREIKYEN